MDRRGFIKALGLGAIGWAATGVAGGKAASAYARPVPFIAKPEETDLLGLISELFMIDPTRTAARQAMTFPQSVAAGDPGPFGCVIWTRVDPATLPAHQSLAPIGWQIATSAGFEHGTIVVEGASLVIPGNDHTIKLPIAHLAIKPFAIYYYRFIFGNVASRTGRFKTLPLPGADISSMRIGYVVCQDYSNGYFTAYKLLAEEEVDVVIHLGDYIYEYLDDGVGGPNGGPVRVVPPFPSGAQYPQGLEDYRHLYQVYRSDPDIQAMHERFAMILLWDDHEFYNDCHQDYHEDTNTPPLTATTPQPGLRSQANRAWSEHGLADVFFNPFLSWEQSVRVYRRFHFGNLIDLVVTDERLYRDGPPCGDITIGERYQTTGCAERTDPARTMLGADQKKWFLDAVVNSKARWKLWANEVMLCQYLLSASSGEFFDLDQWDGYPAERAELLGTIKSAGVQNFVALSGDAHLFLASYLRTDFNDPTEAPMGVELMVGAISSGNYLDAGVDRPAPLSAPQAVTKMAATGLPKDSFSALIYSQNPHIQFWNGSTWGYAILTVTRDSLVCDFRVASTVKQQGGTLQELATFTVPNGQAVLVPQ